MRLANLTNNRTVHILSVGAFGQAVAASLKELLPNVIETKTDQNGLTHPMFWPTADVHLLASWRPATAISSVFNEMCHAWGKPFIEAVYETPLLRVGPVVVPGSGACHACFELRETQHTLRPAEHQVLRKFYDVQPQIGPQGFLAVFAEIAAIRLAQLVESLEQDATSIAGHVWKLNTINRDTVSGKVVGVHGCKHCGLGRDEQTRSFVELQRELLGILHSEFENNARAESEKEAELVLA